MPSQNITVSAVTLAKASNAPATCNHHDHDHASHNHLTAAQQQVVNSINTGLQNNFQLNPEDVMAMCWQEGTPDDVMQASKDAVAKSDFMMSLTGQNGASTPLPELFQDSGNRWRYNANLNDGSALYFDGDCITMTWSIVPDGTSIFGFNGEPTSPSTLVAQLDLLFDCTGGADLTGRCWFPLLESIYESWGAKTGLTFVYEPNDDGASYAGTSPFFPDGVLGVRGDMRIAAHPIDGAGGVLAYNFFPGPFNGGPVSGGGPFGGFIQGGDMVIDLPDLFYSADAAFGLPDPSNDNFRRFRNVVTHEVGHGLGLAHTCPLTGGSKLMEPFASLDPAFDGPQEDDLLGVNRIYGDRLCDTEPTDLGSKSSEDGTVSKTIECVSIHNAGNVDAYTFEIETTTCTVDIMIEPTGSIYLEGPQNDPTMPGNCSAGVPFNAKAQGDLTVQLLDPNGNIVAIANAGGLGQNEVIAGQAVPMPGTYTILVSNSGQDAVQMYNITCSSSTCAIPTMGQWGLFILGMSLTSLALVAIRRKTLA